MKILLLRLHLLSPVWVIRSGGWWAVVLVVEVVGVGGPELVLVLELVLELELELELVGGP